MIDDHDGLEGYCRMLGHQVPFRYCRQVNQKLPCRRILDCWFAQMPIQAFLENHYSEEERRTIFLPPTPKVHQLLDLIAQAQQDVKEENNPPQ